MLVSVLVPVYNRERFIRAALTSLQLQNYADLEILVQDDGSTDATSAIVMDMAERDARIRFERWTPNMGEAAARNRLIERAQGVFIAFLDSDDLAEPTKISLQASFLVDNPNVSAVGTARVIVDAEGNRRLRVVTYPREHATRECMPSFCPASLMYRAEFLRNAAPLRTWFVNGSDVDLVLRASEAGLIRNIPEPLYLQRQHADQMSKLGRSGHMVAVACALYRSRCGTDILHSGAASEETVLRRVLRDRRKLLTGRGNTGCILLLLHAARRVGSPADLLAIALFCAARRPVAFVKVLTTWLRESIAARRESRSDTSQA